MDKLSTISIKLNGGELVYNTFGLFDGKITDAIDSINQSISIAIRLMVNEFLASLSMFFTVAGLACFILTIILGKQKPYLWGLSFWAISALMEVLYG